jgi:hypothetical protein
MVLRGKVVTQGMSDASGVRSLVRTVGAGVEKGSGTAIRATQESSRPREWTVGTMSGISRVEFRVQVSSQLDFLHARCGNARPMGDITICLTGRQKQERKDPLCRP